MPLPDKKTYTSEDYWDLPEGDRAELIDGQFYAMAPPSFIHQKLIMELSATLRDFIKSKGGNCEVIPAPFAVNLNADDETYVEPDISVICDKTKITDKGCNGAPDLLIEIVSPSSRKMDYSKKMVLYSDASVREYWIVDPAKERTTVYHFEEDSAPVIYTFDQTITAGVLDQFTLTIADLLN